MNSENTVDVNSGHPIAGEISFEIQCPHCSMSFHKTFVPKAQLEGIQGERDGGEIELEESCVDRLVRENAELRQKISDMEEEQFNRMVERNLRDSE